MFVVRCPKPTARAHHGRFQPKPLAVKDKTGSSGLVVTPGGSIMVSDYDLMSVWRKSAAGWEKLFISAAGGAARGTYAPDAEHCWSRSIGKLSPVAARLPGRLPLAEESRCQGHGPFRGVQPGRRPIRGNAGRLQEVLRLSRLPWRYDSGGTYNGAGAR